MFLILKKLDLQYTESTDQINELNTNSNVQNRNSGQLVSIVLQQIIYLRTWYRFTYEQLSIHAFYFIFSSFIFKTSVYQQPQLSWCHMYTMITYASACTLPMFFFLLSFIPRNVCKTAGNDVHSKKPLFIG